MHSGKQQRRKWREKHKHTRVPYTHIYICTQMESKAKQMQSKEVQRGKDDNGQHIIHKANREMNKQKGDTREWDGKRNWRRWRRSKKRINVIRNNTKNIENTQLISVRFLVLCCCYYILNHLILSYFLTDTHTHTITCFVWQSKNRTVYI